MTITNQKGIGLLEVMIALMLLAVAVLGYSAMQVRSANISLEADNNIHAVELTRDMHERLRINKGGVEEFGLEKNLSYTGAPSPADCRANECNNRQLAAFDFDQVRQNAERIGMTLAIHRCPSRDGARGSDPRVCIMTAWGDTTATVGGGSPNCITQNGVYNPNAQCVYMESFSYESRK